MANKIQIQIQNTKNKKLPSEETKLINKLTEIILWDKLVLGQLHKSSAIFLNFLNYIFFPLKVTGGNRGIGQAIVKRLSQEFNGIVLFTGNSKK